MTELSHDKENALRDAARHGRIDDVKAFIGSGVNPSAVDVVCVIVDCLSLICLCSVIGLCFCVWFK